MEGEEGDNEGMRERKKVKGKGGEGMSPHREIMCTL